MCDLSVIIPICDEVACLDLVIDCVLKQTFENFELILIDDFYADRLRMIVNVHKDVRVRIVYNRSRLGYYPALNKGLEMAAGKYICVMDVNDIAYPHCFDVQYHYLESHPDVLAVGSHYGCSIHGKVMKRDLPLSYEDVQIALLVDNPFLHSLLMVRTDVMRKHGGYGEKYAYFSDYDLMSRLVLSGRVENLPDILIMGCWHMSQISLLYEEGQEAYEIRRKYQIEFVNRYKKTNQQAMDEWIAGIPEIGRIIALYTYASYTEDVIYEKQADELLEQFLANDIEFIQSLGQESSLGCGLIYILRNGFAEGEENEILAELDMRLSTLCMNWNEKQESSLYGWIHYLTLRIDVSEESVVTPVNKQHLIQLLDRLEDIKIVDDCLLNDLRIIDRLGSFPERTKRLLGEKEIVSINNNKIDKTLDDLVTFVIPVRIDSSERKENLDVVLDLLSKRKQSKIIVLEADNDSKYRVSGIYPNVTYRFVKDDNPIFYRTKYLNELLREADTSIVGIWDTDVIVPNDQIDYSISDILNGKAIMSFPYNGRFNLCSMEDSFIFRHNRLIEFLKEKEYSDCFIHSVGGAFLIHKDYYLKAGGENEHFYGWGMEDMERVKRMEILELPVSRATGVLYHLFHYRFENSRFYSSRLEDESRAEFLKVCSMYKEELIHYIQTWKDVALKFENRVFLSSNIYTKSPFLANYFCLMESYHMAFVIIAKNASSHLRNVLASSLYGFYPNQRGVHSLIGYDDASLYLCPVSKIQEKEKESGRMLKFAVWRDPIERLVSCYKHFCLEKANRFYFQYLALSEDNSFDRFMAFVRFELGKSNPVYQDEHIRRQSDYYNQEDVDYIVPIQKLNQFLEEHGVPVLKKAANETSVNFYLTDRVYIEEIKELYKADYEMKLTY